MFNKKCSNYDMVLLYSNVKQYVSVINFLKNYLVAMLIL